MHVTGSYLDNFVQTDTSMMVYHPFICLLFMNFNENKKNLSIARQQDFKVGGDRSQDGGEK